VTVSTSDENAHVEELPVWAIDQASAELYDVHDRAAIIGRAVGDVLGGLRALTRDYQPRGLPPGPPDEP